MKHFFTNLFALFSSKNPEPSSNDERERLLDYMILAITEGNNLDEARETTEALVSKGEGSSV